MQRTRLRARLLLVSALWLLPLMAAASDRPYAFYTADGRALQARGPLLWVGERAQETDASLGFRLQPVAAPEADAADGDQVWIRSQDGRYLTQLGRWAILTRQPQRALRWQVVRAAGPGTLDLAEAFALQTSDGRYALDTQRGTLVLRPVAESAATPWSLGCHFEAGPFTRAWSSAAAFDIATGERASEVSRAVDWLRATTVDVRTPSGDLPFIVWDDPTLQPHPTVGYVITDTLWAAKALEPYDPELSDRMQWGLMASGWFGNGLHETLFHGVDGLAHKPASSDIVHGTLLERCAFAGQPAEHTAQKAAQLYVPELSVDPDWTEGNSSQFIDSAVYTALNDYWHGEVEQAKERVRGLIIDHRGSGWDRMFWDNERWVLVDQASRCDYDAVAGTCSAACPSCNICEGAYCRFYNAAYKLGLVLYAAKVIGLADDRSLSRALEGIEYRLWEAQHDDGGLAHLILYAPNAELTDKSGSTGEATAIAVLAQSVLRPTDH